MANASPAHARRDTPALTRRKLIGLAGGVVAVLVVGDGLFVTAANATKLTPEAAVSSQNPYVVSPYGSPDFPGVEGMYSAGAAAPEFDASLVEELPWNLRLVNRAWRLSAEFEPEDLARLPRGRWSERKRKHYVDARIIDDLTAMLEAAEEAGADPFVLSSYRTYDYQEDLFARRVERAEEEEGLEGFEAEEAAAFWVAPPGASEHQTGLAVDIVDSSYTELDEGQETTATQQWLMEHCADYGFILRYPTDKSDITDIGYEPWHYRYVGRDIAPAIMESGLCFEEWLAQRA